MTSRPSKHRRGSTAARRQNRRRPLPLPPPPPLMRPIRLGSTAVRRQNRRRPLPLPPPPPLMRPIRLKKKICAMARRNKLFLRNQKALGLKVGPKQIQTSLRGRRSQCVGTTTRVETTRVQKCMGTWRGGCFANSVTNLLYSRYCVSYFRKERSTRRICCKVLGLYCLCLSQITVNIS